MKGRVPETSITSAENANIKVYTKPLFPVDTCKMSILYQSLHILFVLYTDKAKKDKSKIKI